MSAALLAGGLALGGIGSFLGGRSANRAADRQLQAQQAEFEAARKRTGSLFLGFDDYGDFELAQQPLTYQTSSRKGGLSGLFGGKRTTTIDQTDKVQSARDRFSAKYRPIHEELGILGQEAIGRNENELAQITRNTGQLDALAAGNEGAVQDNFEANQARVRRDFAKGREGADQRATAALGYLGPSTLLTNQLTGNARQFGEGESDALTTLGDNRLQRMLAERSRRLALLSGRKTYEEGARSDFERRRYSLLREPVDLRGQIFSQGAYAPYTPLQGGAQSPIGSALASLSGPLSLIGAAGLAGNGGAQGQTSPVAYAARRG